MAEDVRRTIGKYKLGGKDGHTPVEVPDLPEWASWFETADRRVAQDYVDEVQVSTVFLGMDHSLIAGTDPRPVLFESMVFGGEHDGYQERYRTWEDAEAGHRRIVEAISRGEAP